MLTFELTNYYGQNFFKEYIDARPLADRIKSAKEEKERNELASFLANSIIDSTIDWQIENNCLDDEEDLWSQIPYLADDLRTHDLDYLKELNKYIDEDPTTNSAWFYDVYLEGGERWTFQGFKDDYIREYIEDGENIVYRITRIH